MAVMGAHPAAVQGAQHRQALLELREVALLESCRDHGPCSAEPETHPEVHGSQATIH